jgi:hypothetical protein
MEFTTHTYLRARSCIDAGFMAIGIWLKYLSVVVQRAYFGPKQSHLNQLAKLAILVYFILPICKTSKQAYCAQALMERSVISSEPLTGAAPCFRIFRLG